MNARWSVVSWVLFGILSVSSLPTLGDTCKGINLLLTLQGCYDPAWRRWQKPENIALGFVGDMPAAWEGSLSNAKSIWTSYASYVTFQDGNNIAGVVIPGPDVAYVEESPKGCAYVTSVTMEYDTSVDYASVDDGNSIHLGSLFLHEIGHVLGLVDNSSCWNSIMVGQLDYDTHYTELKQADKEAVDILYGWLVGCGTWGCIKDLYNNYGTASALSALSGGDNTLVWSVPDHDPANYLICRAQNAVGDDDFEQIGSTLRGDTVFIDSDVSTGSTYHYRVVSIDGDTLMDSNVSSAGLKRVGELFPLSHRDCYCNAMVTDGQYLYVALCDQPTEIRKISADPHNPAQANWTEINGRRPLVNLAIDRENGFLFFLDCNGLVVIDTDLSFVGELDGLGTHVIYNRCEDVSIDSGFAYVACGINGIKAVNYNNPSQPTVWGTHFGPGSPGDYQYKAVESVGEYLYVRSCPPGTFDWFSEILMPIVNDSLQTVEFAVVCTSQDVSCWSGTYYLEPILKGAARGRYAIGCSVDGTYAVLDTRDPSRPVPLKYFDAPAFGIQPYYSYDFDDRYLYTTGPWEDDPYGRGLFAFDIFSPDTIPIYAVGDTLGERFGGKVVSHAKYLYVCDRIEDEYWPTRLRVFEKADFTPVWLMTPASDDTLSDLAVISGTISDLTAELDSFVVEWGQGLNPSEWSGYGVQIECNTCPILEDTIAVWNTGTVSAGTYTIRVIATYGADSFETQRTVDVTHDALLVDVSGGQPFVSIQSALESVEMGDTIRVLPSGDYVENVIMKETVHLIGVGGGVKLMGVGDSPVVTINDHDYPCSIEGFDISHQDGEYVIGGPGIRIQNSSPTISTCTIRNNIGTAGNGVSILGDSHPQISNCVIRDNEASEAAGVQIVGNGGTRPAPTFTDCEIVSNHATEANGWGGGVYISYDTPLTSTYPQPEFRRCRIDNNHAEAEGAAVWLSNCHDALFESCTFVANYGFGIISGLDAGVRFTNCTMVANTGYVYAGNDCANPVIVLNPFDELSKVIKVDNCIIAFNDGPAVGGGVISNSTEVTDSDLYGNCADQYSPSDADWVTLGLNNISADPAFCGQASADYSLYAFSPCAPGGAQVDLMGAFPVECLPGATISFSSVDSPEYGPEGSDTLVIGSPAGRGEGVQVSVQLDSAVMTRDIGAGELTLALEDDQFALFSSVPISADGPASGPNYETTITHMPIGGVGPDSLRVFLNGVPLDAGAYVHVRSPDFNRDGVVNIIDQSVLAQHFPPNPYDERFDYNADGAISIPDLATFAHYMSDHFDGGQQAVAGGSSTSNIEVAFSFTEEELAATDRCLYVDVYLDYVDPFSILVLSLRNEHPDLTFSSWEENDGYGGQILFTPVVREGTNQLYYAVVGADFSGTSIFLGQLKFDIRNGAELKVYEGDFAMLIGEVLSIDGAASSFHSVTGAHAVSGPEPYRNSLGQNYPNPFNPTTTIEYSLAQDGHVGLSIYNVAGQLVRTLVGDQKQGRNYRIVWNAKDNAGSPVASAVYFYRLETPNFTSTKKMVLVR